MSHVDMDGLLAALQATSDSFTEKHEHIALLEAGVGDAEAENARLRAEIAGLIPEVESAEAAARAATTQADETERQVQVHLHRADELQARLIVAIDDLSDIGSAVDSLLGKR